MGRGLAAIPRLSHGYGLKSIEQAKIDQILGGQARGQAGRGFQRCGTYRIGQNINKDGGDSVGRLIGARLIGSVLGV